MVRTIEPREVMQTRGVYKGVSYNICHPFSHYKWTYYIYLRLDLFQDKELAESLWLTAEKPDERFETKFYRYYNNKLINNLWFHGGCTWYSKEYDSNDNRVIKIGCDYSHLWDEGRHYTIDGVLEAAKATIDDLHENYVYGEACEGEHLRKTTIS